MNHHAPHELRNMLAAVAVSVAIMLAWGYFFPAGKHGATPAPTAAAPKEAAAVPSAAKPAKKDTAAPAPRLSFASPDMDGSMSLRGLRIDDVRLKNYDESANKPEDGKVRLLHPDKELYFVESGLIAGRGQSVKMPGRDALWRIEEGGNDKLAPGAPVTLIWEEGGVKVRRTLAMNDRFAFTVTDAVVNAGDAPLAFSAYGAAEKIAPEEEKRTMLVHHGALVLQDGKLEETNFKDLRKARQINGGGGRGWTGITDQYWLTAIVPDQNKRADIELRFFADAEGFPRVQAGAIGEEITVAPGETGEYAMTIYAGAKELTALDAIREHTGAELFDRAIDFGWVYFLSKPMLKLLEWLRGVTGNMGLAIIALTVIVRLILFPLANKSFIGMQRLKELHPKLEEIRFRLKSDPMKMNKEVMQLYQREKVNPMTSGCLPVFLQFPVFFALYKVLLTSIEMRYAPFYGWITNLSAPDPTNIFTLFGLVPWNPPGMLHIGALPALLGITMILQQKLAPAAGDETQRKVMRMLPYIFTFFMASFPAGLVLYWTMSNSLSILQQYVLLRRFKAKREAAAR